VGLYLFFVYMKYKPTVEWYKKRHVQIDSQSGCWIWTGSRHRRGYGRAGKQGAAHRLFFEYYVEPIKAGNFVCHTCDNPPCVNPFHLFQGTCQDNVNDMVSKNRQAFGEKSGTATLTEADVRRIISEEFSNLPLSKVAVEFNVNKSLIHKIRTGEAWALVTGIPLKPSKPKQESYKLKADQVIEIRRKHSEGKSYAELMKEYNVSRANISLIINRINWKNI
jgi:hypothetical protein